MHAVHETMKHLEKVFFVFHEPLEESAEGIFARYSCLAFERVETAELPELSVSPKLPPKGFDMGMLKDDAGDNRVPGGADGVVVAASTAAFLKNAHQILVDKGQCAKNELESVEVVWRQEFPDRDAARAAEQQIKRWNRAKKEALIAGDFDLLHLLAGRSKLSRAVRDASK